MNRVNCFVKRESFRSRLILFRKEIENDQTFHYDIIYRTYVFMHTAKADGVFSKHKSSGYHCYIPGHGLYGGDSTERHPDYICSQY